MATGKQLLEVAGCGGGGGGDDEEEEEEEEEAAKFTDGHTRRRDELNSKRKEGLW